MQPAPYPYAPYQYNNGAPMPVRYAMPTGYRQGSPPFANMAFDRYGNVAAGVRPAMPMMQPIRPRFPSNPMPAPVVTSPQGATPGEVLQPPTPFYYNPYGKNPPAPSPDTKSVASKKGAKEYKETAFTIRPDGAEGETIRGLVSNNDINDLLKQRGTKVKVSKIYRITKTKPEAQQADSSDEEIPLPTPNQRPSLAPAAAARAAATAAATPSTAPPAASQRRSSSSSSCSTCCSQCSCSSSDYDDRRRRSHSYDNCPECRAERERDRHRQRRRRR